MDIVPVTATGVSSCIVASRLFGTTFTHALSLAISASTSPSGTSFFSLNMSAWLWQRIAPTRTQKPSTGTAGGPKPSPLPRSLLVPPPPPHPPRLPPPPRAAGLVRRAATHQHAAAGRVAADPVAPALGERLAGHRQVDRVEDDDSVVLHAQGRRGVDPVAGPAGRAQLGEHLGGVVAALAGDDDVAALQ